jgi:histidyl-tRNA synthetase
VDVIGSNSLLNEVELIQIIDKIFRKLGIEITIKLNNRKILSGIAEIIGANDKIIDIAVALDKVEKIGWENVIKELQLKGLTENSINLLFDIFDYGERSDKSIVLNAPKAPDRLILGNLLDTLKNSNIGIKGINEVLKILEIIKEICFDIDYKIEFDPSLARGLNYYTGAIFEVKANAVAIGSICGGGRYDDLTSIFGLPGVSGVGVSFGADRIYDVMNELNLFPSETNISTKVLFVNFGDEEEMYALNAIINMRNAGIASEIYPDASKLKKQFYYADCRNIPYVVIAGSEEIDQNCFKLKNMATREEKKISLNEMINELKNEYI